MGSFIGGSEMFLKIKVFFRTVSRKMKSVRTLTVEYE